MRSDEITLRIFRRDERGGWWMDVRWTDRQGVRRRQRSSLTATSQKAAHLEGSRFVAELEAKLAAPEVEAPKRAAFSGLVDHWLNLHGPGVKASTLKTYRQTAEVHLLPYFGHVDVREIDVEAVARLRANLSTSRAPKTVNNVIGVLKHIMRSAVDWGYADRNPCERIKPIAVEEAEPAWWTPEQSAVALAWTKEHRPRWYLWLLLSLRTGMRWGEVIGLRWEDVRLDHETPHALVRQAWSSKVKAIQSPKSRRHRRIPLSSAVVEVLRAIPAAEREGLLCPSLSGKAEARSLTAASKLMTAIAKKAKLPRIRVHDLRHTFCSQLVSKGTDLNRVRVWAGHRDFKTTLRYAHLHPLDGADGVDVLD